MFKLAIDVPFLPRTSIDRFNRRQTSCIQQRKRKSLTRCHYPMSRTIISRRRGVSSTSKEVYNTCPSVFTYTDIPLLPPAILRIAQDNGAFPRAKQFLQSGCHEQFVFVRQPAAFAANFHPARLIYPRKVSRDDSSTGSTTVSNELVD